MLLLESLEGLSASDQVKVSIDQHGDHVLKYGGKQFILMLPVNEEQTEVGLAIDNIPGAEKIPGATTALFQKVVEIIQAEANKRTQPLVLNFYTKEERLKFWLKTPTSQKLFHWQVVEDDVWFQAKATFTRLKAQ